MSATLIACRLLSAAQAADSEGRSEEHVRIVGETPVRQSYPVAMPDSARQLTIHAPSGPLASIDARPGGPILGVAVFVPGFSGSKEDFIPMLGVLTSAGYRVVCFDQRGQFESGGPTEPSAYTVKMFTEDLLAVVNFVGNGQPVHLLGHSFGGIVARRATIAVPSSVCSLTLLGSGPDGASLSRRRLLGPLAWLIRLGGLRIVAALMTRVASRAGVPDNRLPWVRDRLLETNPANLVGICKAMADEPDLVDKLAATAVPVLVLYGENDDGWLPQKQVDMARRLAARVKIIRNTGHTPNEDQPQETAEALLEFWSNIAGRRT